MEGCQETKFWIRHLFLTRLKNQINELLKCNHKMRNIKRWNNKKIETYKKAKSEKGIVDVKYKYI